MDSFRKDRGFEWTGMFPKGSNGKMVKLLVKETIVETKNLENWNDSLRCVKEKNKAAVSRRTIITRVRLMRRANYSRGVFIYSKWCGVTSNSSSFYPSIPCTEPQQPRDFSLEEPAPAPQALSRKTTRINIAIKCINKRISK